MGKLIDLAGRRFGKVTVIERAENTSGRPRWICQCDCGRRFETSSNSLKNGIKSCGHCTQHGEAVRGKRTSLYNRWQAMKARCNNPNASGYENYGGRGITVCAEWQESFEAFQEWATSAGYKECLTLDRIDVDGDYSPENCRWISDSEQRLNTRRNRLITIGEETKTLKEWCDEYGAPYNTVESRITKNGWVPEKAIKTPVRVKQK